MTDPPPGPPATARSGTLGLRLEGAEGDVPEAIQPGAQLPETLRVDLVEAPGSVRLIGDEPCCFQRFQVLRHSGPAHRHTAGDLADGFRPVAQPLEHRPAGRIGESTER